MAAAHASGAGHPRGAAIVAGALLVGWPTLAIDIAVVVGGLLLLYLGVGELLTALGAAPLRERLSLAGSRWGLAASLSSLGVLIGGAAIALAAAGGTSSRPPTLARPGPATATRSCARGESIRSSSPAHTTRCRPPTRRAG